MNIWDNLDFLSRCICSFPLYGESMEDGFFVWGRFHLESRTGTLRTSSEMGCGCPRSSQLLGVTCVVLRTPPASARALCHHVLRGGWDMLLAHLHQPLLLPEYTNTSFWVHRLSSVYATYATHPRRSIEVFIQSYVSRACRAFASSPRTPSAVLGRRRSLRAVPLDFFKSL